MTIRHLRIFAAVVDCGTMHAAAQKLYLSQPTITQAVKELEEHYGCLLFERYGRRLMITPAGQELLGHARELLGVYERMEQTGIRTGILFLDEINCVSETLMPAMLQLLQSKQFGTHRLPEGWVIAAAGNPPAYNESARSFDTVTMDRVRLLEISENYPVWRDYAHAKGLHPAVLSYLELNPEHFW